jgi:hypothetical protein
MTSRRNKAPLSRHEDEPPEKKAKIEKVVITEELVDEVLKAVIESFKATHAQAIRAELTAMNNEIETDQDNDWALKEQKESVLVRRTARKITVTMVSQPAAPNPTASARIWTSLTNASMKMFTPDSTEPVVADPIPVGPQKSFLAKMADDTDNIGKIFWSALHLVVFVLAAWAILMMINRGPMDGGYALMTGDWSLHKSVTLSAPVDRMNKAGSYEKDHVKDRYATRENTSTENDVKLNSLNDPLNAGYKEKVFTTRETHDTEDDVKLNSLNDPPNAGYKEKVFTTRETHETKDPLNADYKQKVFTTHETHEKEDDVKLNTLNDPSNAGYKEKVFTTQKTTEITQEVLVVPEQFKKKKTDNKIKQNTQPPKHTSEYKPGPKAKQVLRKRGATHNK